MENPTQGKETPSWGTGFAELYNDIKDFPLLMDYYSGMTNEQIIDEGINATGDFVESSLDATQEVAKIPFKVAGELGDFAVDTLELGSDVATTALEKGVNYAFDKDYDFNTKFTSTENFFDSWSDDFNGFIDSVDMIESAADDSLMARRLMDFTGDAAHILAYVYTPQLGVNKMYGGTSQLFKANKLKDLILKNTKTLMEVKKTPIDSTNKIKYITKVKEVIKEDANKLKSLVDDGLVQIQKTEGSLTSLQKGLNESSIIQKLAGINQTPATIKQLYQTNKKKALALLAGLGITGTAVYKFFQDINDPIEQDPINKTEELSRNNEEWRQTQGERGRTNTDRLMDWQINDESVWFNTKDKTLWTGSGDDKIILAQQIRSYEDADMLKSNISEYTNMLRTYN